MELHQIKCFFTAMESISNEDTTTEWKETLPAFPQREG